MKQEVSSVVAHSTPDRIIEQIQNKGPQRPADLTFELQVSRVTIQATLKKLVSDGVLVRRGASPRVYYALNDAAPRRDAAMIAMSDMVPLESQELLERYFTLIMPDGTEIAGADGFVAWCRARALPVAAKAVEFTEYMSSLAHLRAGGVLDATHKLATTFTEPNRFLDNLYYLEPYSIPVFGRLKLAQWLFYGKQSQSMTYINKTLEYVLPLLQEYCETLHPDAIAWVPPSVPRKVQFMDVLARSFRSGIPQLKIVKIPSIIQQKSLKDLSDRQHNAQTTFVIPEYDTHRGVVLLVDDFTGSGATLNELAKKLKQQKIADKVVGLTLTGSMNGFEVIREV